MQNFTFCSDSASVWQMVGYFLLVLKVVIPIVIIILGMIDLGKAVIASDEKQISKSAKSLLNRVLAGIAIFFVPTLIGVIFKLVGGFGEVKGQYDICAACVSSPTGGVCTPCATQEGSNSSACKQVINDIEQKYNK